jgi:hypothetical protein
VSSSSTTASLQDYAFFVEPNLDRIEKLRQWLMSPFDFSNQKAGYDPNFGMIRGGHWPNSLYGSYQPTFRDGFVLIDNNILIGESLDYLNSLKGISTNIGQVTRNLLNSTTFIDPVTGATANYQGNDRREVFFGKKVPCIINGFTQIWYMPAGAYNGQQVRIEPPLGGSDGTPSIVTEFPNNENAQWDACLATGSSQVQDHMEFLAPAAELAFLNGDGATAQSLFNYATSLWQPSQGSGINGSTGGSFVSPMQTEDALGRTLFLYIHMARATGYWNVNDSNRTVAQQVVNQAWTLQGPDGDVGTAETAGQAILSHDTRVPAWFGHS